MNENYTKEIDWIDLFIDWISHWKSLFIVLVVSMIFAGGYMFIKSGNTVSTKEEEVALLENLPEGTMLSSLTAEQLKMLTVKDMEKYFLSDKDVKAVDEVIALSDEYNENIKEYNAIKAELDFVDRAESFNYIANSKNIIEIRRAALSADQQIYYYAKLGLSIAIGEDNVVAVDDDQNVAENGEAVDTSSKKIALLFVLMMIGLHFIVVAVRYIFSGTIKHSDNISEMVNVPEYTRIVDWEKIDSAKGINRIANKVRFCKSRKTSLNNVIEINTTIIIEKLTSRNYKSLAVLGVGLDAERDFFVHEIEKNNRDIIVKSIDSITHSVNGADDIIGVDAAVLVVRIGKSLYNDFFEELKSLKDRNVDVIGIATFE